MHIRYEDIGCPPFAGVFPFRACMVEVLFQHIIVWRAYPAAVFETDRAWPVLGSRTLRLTRWSVPGVTTIKFD